jgi:hypothetical protein
MAEAIAPEELATRVRALIDNHDEGDVSRAAQRLGTRECDLHALLAGQHAQPNVAALSAIVRGYDVDTWWLITGETDVGSGMSTEQHIGRLSLLSELGTTLTLQRRLDARFGGRAIGDDATTA